MLRRARLEDLLDEAFGKRLTTVVAGPGFGKSTLVAHWMSDLDAAWYAVEIADASMSVFSRAWSRVFARACPSFRPNSSISEGSGVPARTSAEGPRHLAKRFRSLSTSTSRMT
jgi:hypothetical protein